MPAGPTYESIATATLGSTAATITFSSIPATYTDLIVRIVGGINDSSVDNGVYVRFNSDTATNYSYTALYGSGSAASSFRGTSQNRGLAAAVTAANGTPSVFGYGEINIMNYAGSTFKTCIGSGSGDKNGSGDVSRWVTLWRSTSAITTVQLLCNATATGFVSGTVATIYGVKSA